MISMDTFSSLLNSCRHMNQHIANLHKLGIFIDDNNPVYRLIDSVIGALDEEFNTNSVSYYFFERDCNGIEMNGKPTPFLWEADGREVWIESDDELYLYLKKQRDEV